MNTNKNKSSANPLSFWTAVNAVMLSLILKTAFDEIWENTRFHVDKFENYLYTYNFSSLSNERLLVFPLFFLLLARFHGGSVRFGQIKVHRDDTVTLVKNMLGSFFLLAFFFYMGHTLNDTKSFLAVCFMMHLIDGLWFLATSIHSSKYKLYAKRKTSLFFLFLTVMSIIFFLLLDDIFTIYALLFLTFVDFILFSPFYKKESYDLFGKKGKIYPKMKIFNFHD